jgi:hypothetical protein
MFLLAKSSVFSLDNQIEVNNLHFIFLNFGKKYELRNKHR